MTMTLEPCPFCGAAPIWRPQGNDHTKSRKLTLSCSGCRIQITNAAIRHDMDWLYRITAEAWNTRTQPAQSVDVAKVREVIASIDLRAETYLDPQCKAWVDKLTAALQATDRG